MAHQVLEDFLTDDVQYNWVQMFRVQEPLRPVFDSKAQDSMKTERIARSSDKVCVCVCVCVCMYIYIIYIYIYRRYRVLSDVC
jgi:hypothetical protein